MILRHYPQVKSPDSSRIEDGATRSFCEEINNLLKKIARDVYDDLNRLLTQVVDTLPAASADYHQRFMLLNHAGAAQTLHVCIYNEGTSAYQWKTVTLT